MNNISQLSQIFNSFNNVISGMRLELDGLKAELLTLKVQTMSNVPNGGADQSTTQLIIEELQKKVESLETSYSEAFKDEVASIRENQKTLDEKVSSVEKAALVKMNNFEKSLKEKSGVNKEEVQALIDQSISMLLGGIKPNEQLTDHKIQNNPVFVSLETITEGDEHSEPVPTGSDMNINSSVLEKETSVVEEPTTVVIEAPKTTRGRGRGRGKKITQ